MRATRALIHLEHLQYNLAAIREKLPAGIRICVPVKADAYGHGALRVAVAAIRSGASHLAVAAVQEGIDLREAGIVAPILSLSLPIPEEIPHIIEYELTPLVMDADFIAELGRCARAAGKTVPVHLKIDTGMTRIGCSCAEAPELARLISREKGLVLEGVATHLSVADSPEPGDRAYTTEQLDRFDSVLAAMRRAGTDPGIVHAANSGAILLHPRALYGMARPGILVYGYLPDPALEGMIEVKPVMELETQVVSIKPVEAGTAVSYGRTWTADRDTTIATLPIGYADGLPRRLSPGLTVRIGEEQFPVVGRICMDQCMVDVGPDPWVQRWDRVTIFGPRPAAASAETLASLAGTIPYEITCGINKRVPRVYVGEERRPPCGPIAGC